MKPREFEHWLETGGSTHLATHYVVDTDDLPDAPAIEANDVMKWANG
jgi:hypothetical protein